MKNQVVAGDYKNWDVIFNFGKMYFMHRLKKIKITKSMVSSWDVIDDIEKNSVWCPIIGAGVGSMLFGTIGAFAGAAVASGRSNSTYLISVEFISGKRSLLQLDSQGYNNLVKSLY